MVFSFSRLKKKNVLVLCHAGADVDAIASAASLFFALRKISNVSVGVPDHVSLPAKNFAEAMKVPFSVNPSLGGIDCLIMVDLNTAEMLGTMKSNVLSFPSQKIVIDHHEKAKNPLLESSVSIIDEKSVSCSLLVFELLKKQGFPVSREIALSAIAGIIVDSSFFSVADSRAFDAVSFCLKKSSSSVQEILSLFKTKKDASEKIAALKAAKRARIFRLGEFVCAVSEVGAFEAASASALVRTGADIAFVGTVEKNELRVSARANSVFLKQTGIDLAWIMKELAKHFEGEGGGHEGAAGFNGKAESFAQVSEKLVETTFSQVKKNFPLATVREHS